MNKKVLYIGIDVDDNSFHGSIFDKDTGEIDAFKCRPTTKGLNNRLEKLKIRFPSHLFKICYEASYIGFSLQRELVKLGFHCDVVAPNSVPRVKGNQIKTDRIDAEKLAQFYANDLLTAVVPPNEEMERDRDLLRSRQRVLHQLSEIRSHIQSLLRRSGINFRSETKFKSYWTKLHISWLEKKANDLPGSLGANLKLLLQQMNWLSHTLDEYGKLVDELAESKTYQPTVKALISYKGIKNIFAMILITEIGNIKRFSHPRKLVSFMGLDIREYSSGGIHRRFGITKHGNKHLRTVMVEANQRSYKSVHISKKLKQRRKGVDPELVLVADRCNKRLVKKGRHLTEGGKNANKVKIACAREMVGFVWESMMKVSA